MASGGFGYDTVCTDGEETFKLHSMGLTKVSQVQNKTKKIQGARDQRVPLKGQKFLERSKQLVVSGGVDWRFCSSSSSFSFWNR